MYRKLTNQLPAFLLLFSLLFGACTAETVEPDERRQGYDFFPLVIGNYSIFEVERVDYQISSEPDTSRYELKQVVQDYYLDQQEDTVFLLYRYTRESNDQWEKDSVFTVKKSPSKLIMTESNVPYVKIAFPVSKGLNWDGNAYNSNPRELYRIDSLDQTFHLEDTVLEQTMTIIHSDKDQLSDRQDYRYEVYGRDLGLIFKFDNVLNYCVSDTSCINQGIIESGYQLTQKLKEYGQE